MCMSWMAEYDMTEEPLLPGSGSTSSRASVAEPLCSQCVSWASMSLCVAVPYVGDVLTSTDPLAERWNGREWSIQEPLVWPTDL